MGDAENNSQPSKKRAAGVQLSRDNPGLDDNEETPEQEGGTFKRASDEVLATRRIVKVRRQQTSTTDAPAPSSASNPFASIRLIPSASTAPPEEAEASSGKSKEAEQIDDRKSESKGDEPKGESPAEGEETAVNEDSAKQSESKVDDSKTEPNAQKDETNEVSNLDTTKSEVGEVAEGGNSGDGVSKATEAVNSETETRKDVENEADNSETETRKDVENEGNDDEKENGEKATEKNAETAPFSSFQRLSSSQNAFSGLTGTGFSSTTFSFGSISKDGSGPASGTESIFSLKSDNPTFSFGISTNGSSSIFGNSVASTVNKSESSKFPPKQEVSVETGEENEKAVFTSDSVLFEFIDGSWKERGKGELKVNVSTTGTGKARLVMRARGNYRLILNASLFPDMKLTNMDKKGITFACVNSAIEGKDGLSTIALKFKDASIVEDFRAAVMEHKPKMAEALKTPENSPKASDE
ncbi:Ran-binding protein RANBP1 [Handroanthus impetiginosus]|uniref:Ran-binding protein RANBP1 n=1 Tax=Handroanthus impetiginosus TaxID=429701 RepID=A0A2G9GX47_9LAMI|nr:Ran-binding protein RANBP1 [Handroanthus impetiginosus]